MQKILSPDDLKTNDIILIANEYLDMLENLKEKLIESEKC